MHPTPDRERGKMTTRGSRDPHWSLHTAALLSLCSLMVTPKAASLAELLGMWMIPLLLGLYGLQRIIQVGALLRQVSTEDEAHR
jgi:hypothetical protein